MQNKTYPSADKGDGEPFPDKPPRRLSPAELSSLFRRLDVNGDGELSIAEFRKIVEKLDLLKLHQQTNATTSEATLKKVVDDAVFEAFVASDTDKTSRGSLNLLEFRSAYNALYNKISHFRISKKSAESKSIVRATRYGSFM